MSNAHLFRQHTRTQDSLVRLTMPRLTAREVATDGRDSLKPAPRVWSAGSLVTKRAFTLGEVAHASENAYYERRS